MNVTIYTSPTCPYCDNLKDFLKEKGLKFKEIDISKNKEAATEITERSGLMGVPITEIDSKFIAGFDKEKIEKEILFNKTDIKIKYL